MPELPDVEVYRKVAQKHALNRPVDTASIRPDGMTMTVSEGTLRDALLGHTLTATARWGKHLLLRSGEDRHRWLRLHFGMSGSLVPLDEGEKEPDHTRLRLDFRGGARLAYRCPRKLGEIGLVASPEALAEERDLGPDLLQDGMGPATFRDRVGSRQGGLKSALMDQSVVAGLGSDYSDEILFQTDLHPEVDVQSLEPEALESLYRTALRVVNKAIDVGVDIERMPRTWLLPHREPDAPCPRCGGTIRKTEVNGRPTYHCDRHQARS